MTGYTTFFHRLHDSQLPVMSRLMIVIYYKVNKLQGKYVPKKMFGR